MNFFNKHTICYNRGQQLPNLIVLISTMYVCVCRFYIRWGRVNKWSKSQSRNKIFRSPEATIIYRLTTSFQILIQVLNDHEWPNCPNIYSCIVSHDTRYIAYSHHLRAMTLRRRTVSWVQWTMTWRMFVQSVSRTCSTFPFAVLAALLQNLSLHFDREHATFAMFGGSFSYSGVVVVAAGFLVNAFTMGEFKSIGPFFIQLQNEFDANAQQSSLFMSLLYGAYFACGKSIPSLR